MYKHLVVYVLDTAINKTEHGLRLLDFVRQVFGKLEVVLESNTRSFSEVTRLRSIRLSPDPIPFGKCVCRCGILLILMCIVLHFATLNLSFHMSYHSSNLSMSFWRSLV